jgi:glycosyltransferase involved in cell wall biosynthesis
MVSVSEPQIAAPSATFRETDIVLDQGGAFSIELPDATLISNVSVIIDIYDLDNPAHPEGHIGWWRYELEQLGRQASGNLSLDEAGDVSPAIQGTTPADQWRNPNHIDWKRLELLIVLRSTITNAILSVDRIPALPSDQDLATFRSSFDRNYQSPRYAPPHALLPADRNIHIVSRNMLQRDAVGNLCLGLYRMLRQHQASVHLFGDDFDLVMNDIINRRETLPSAVGPDDIIIYFFSTYDRHLPALVDLACYCKIGYFHGVTLPKLLQVFDPELSAASAKAIGQIPLLRRFDRLAANSGANASVLREILAKEDYLAPIGVIPPKLIGDDELHLASSTVAEDKPVSPNFLFVGRIKSHKRIEDILGLLAAYRKLDPSARCVIVGHSDNPAYRDYLRWVQSEQLKLPEDAVSWSGSIPEHELAKAYEQATVYVSMSEDEGFCLPLLEAMMRNVLIFAYDRPAVRETLGGAGMIFTEKSFEHLSRQLHFLLGSPDMCRKIRQAQHRRAEELAGQMDGRGFLELLKS